MNPQLITRSCCLRIITCGLAADVVLTSLQIPVLKKKKKQKNPNMFFHSGLARSASAHTSPASWSGGGTGRFGSGPETLEATFINTPVRDQCLLGKKKNKHTHTHLNLSSDTTANVVCVWLSEHLHIKDFFISTPTAHFCQNISLPIKPQTRPN